MIYSSPYSFGFNLIIYLFIYFWWWGPSPRQVPSYSSLGSKPKIYDPTCQNRRLIHICTTKTGCSIGLIFQCDATRSLHRTMLQYSFRYKNKIITYRNHLTISLVEKFLKKTVKTVSPMQLLAKKVYCTVDTNICSPMIIR